MSEIKPMYFVGRVDVSADSGSQRAFGAFDTGDAAAAFAATIQLPGEFIVFEGVPRLRLINKPAPRQAEPI